ncbi:hypothetical protein R70006_06822 [Paraburkholderia domus]|nr:hypothetical protein R75483_06377 [Paraburkholderia domus]CAE6834783.1 hypothetical protein R70006_06822 [Paraburkholderia domus]
MNTDRATLADVRGYSASASFMGRFCPISYPCDLVRQGLEETPSRQTLCLVLVRIFDARSLVPTQKVDSLAFFSVEQGLPKSRLRTQIPGTYGLVQSPRQPEKTRQTGPDRETLRPNALRGFRKNCRSLPSVQQAGRKICHAIGFGFPVSRKQGLVRIRSKPDENRNGDGHGSLICVIGRSQHCGNDLPPPDR